MEQGFLRVGDKLPDFWFEVYQNNSVKKINSYDYKGKWLVIAFYPGDFTYVCPTELEEISNNLKDFVKLNAQVVSLSVDSPSVHKAWHDSTKSLKQITFPMGSDPTGSISRMFGTFDKDKQTSIRATYIFDPEGVLRVIEMHDVRIGRSVFEIIRKLSAAKYVHDHLGEMCPASWEEGEPTIKPNKKSAK